MPAFSGLDPPIQIPIIDPTTGTVAEVWRRYFRSVGTLIGSLAPIDAQYWLSTSNSVLSGERNLGSLASGYLKITTGLGIATPSSSATIPQADVSGLAAALALLAPLASPSLTGVPLAPTAAPGTTTTQIATTAFVLASLLGVNVTHASVVKVFADSPYAVVVTDETIRANAVGGAMTITLPAAATSGRRLTVKKIDASANVVTVSAGANTVDGAGTRALALQWTFCTVEGDGSNWLVVATG